MMKHNGKNEGRMSDFVQAEAFLEPFAGAKKCAYNSYTACKALAQHLVKFGRLKYPKCTP